MATCVLRPHPSHYQLLTNHMPNLKAAKKALRHNQRQRAINDNWRRSTKEVVKAVRDAIKLGDAKAAIDGWPAAQQALDQVARRNILHPRTVARQKSRLQHAIQKITATK